MSVAACAASFVSLVRNYDLLLSFASPPSVGAVHELPKQTRPSGLLLLNIVHSLLFAIDGHPHLLLPKT